MNGTSTAIVLTESTVQNRKSFWTRSRKVILYQFVVGALALAAWEWMSGRVIDPFWVSSPSRIFKHLIGMIQDGSLLMHAQVTLTEAIVGYVVGALLGVAFGFVLAETDMISRVLNPFIMGFYGMPRVALAPLFIIWFGIDTLSKVMLVILVVFFLTFFNTFSGVRGVSSTLKNLCRVWGGNGWDVFLKVTLPASIPWIISGLKISLPYAIVGAVTGEFIAASRGLGWYISLSSNMFNTTAAMVGLLVLSFIVVTLNGLLDRLENKLMRWRPSKNQQGVAGGSDLY